MSKTMMKAPPDLPEPVGAVCPYCNQILDKRPKRKKKCPHCANYIYVRTLPSGNGTKVLVTEEGAEQIELEWERIRFRNRWLSTLGQYGTSDKDFDAHKRKLAKRFGHEPSDADVIWGLFNTVVERAMKGGDHGLQPLYFEMALFLYEEGRPFQHLRQQAAKMELLGLGRMSHSGLQVEILAGRDSCSACKEQSGKRLSVEDALEQMPIPCTDCTYELSPGKPGWCRCVFLPWKEEWAAWE